MAGMITPIELNDQLRCRVYRLAAFVMAVLMLGCLISERYPVAAIAGAFGALLWINSWFVAHGHQRAFENLSNALMALLCLLTLVAVARFPQTAEHWSYLVPLVAFLIYRLKVATTLVTVYSLVLSAALVTLYHGPERIQIFFTYLAVLMLTVAFVYLREIREEQLKPLRKTDNLTQALTREYLIQDLEKEIQRSEREGTDLSVMALGLDPESVAGLDEEGRDLLLHRLGRLLHGTLRLFDSYYRHDDTRFVIILPHTGSRAALKTSTRLRRAIRETLSDDRQAVTASVGLVTLNAGDDAHSLIRHALMALEQARRQGPSQSVAFEELAPEECEQGGVHADSQ